MLLRSDHPSYLKSIILFIPKSNYTKSEVLDYYHLKNLCIAKTETYYSILTFFINLDSISLKLKLTMSIFS